MEFQNLTQVNPILIQRAAAIVYAEKPTNGVVAPLGVTAEP